jgi:NAD(P)-dependent dehydrogenase (short-subunit alcohol dehydrogenase family)
MYSRLEFTLHGALGAVIYLVTFPVVLIIGMIGGFSSARIADAYTRGKISQDMKGKIVVVTGSNCGVGFETASNLALRGATVVLACRDPTKGETAVAEIQAAIEKEPLCSNNNGKVVFIQLDLDSFESVKIFATEFGKQFSRLDVLVNNGGINTSGITSYGLQQTFCTNYLGHYFLFCLLEPLLATVDTTGFSSGGRVVNLSSVMHHVGSSDFKTSAYFGTHTTDNMANNNTYSDSKLYMNFLTMEINRRYCLAENGGGRRSITAVSVNPGAVRSSIWRAIPWPVSTLYDIFVMRVFFLSPEEGAASSIFASCVPSSELFRPSDLELVADGTQKIVVPKNCGSGKKSGPFCGHIFLPYATPYRCSLLSHAASTLAPRTPYCPAGSVSGSSSVLGLEALGAFRGPQWSAASLPLGADVTAVALWDFSRELIIEKSGMKNPFLL